MPVDAVAPLLEVRDLSVHFRQRGRQGDGWLRAVDHVDLHIAPGEVLGLAGESGSGKTTLGYAIVGHHRPTGGTITFGGVDLSSLPTKARRSACRDLQMIFQDPYSSLNPRMKVGDAVAEPLRVHGLAPKGPEALERAADLLEQCGLPRDAVHRYPHAFSGGQRQRIGIARALALSPRLIVADEPTSALDVSIQAQIVNLLRDLQQRLGVAYLFISHNLAVLRHVADRIAVMRLGRIVETGPTEEIFEDPQHPYTRSLLAAIPVPDVDDDWFARLSANPTPLGWERERDDTGVDGVPPPLVEVSPGHHVAPFEPVVSGS